ncbi:hypothetical protein [Aureivirga sp. CE67]|uniref:hypothetical protein n=1 Tax=Aureivirga sp. CE67 TaxID=1788983 RepID=UPI0018C9C057|nr:hypothetical protein [Aureivirga sp. CE67]
MKHLTDIHAESFYTTLTENAQLILELATAIDEEGETVEYWWFEDAMEESEEEETELNDHGFAYFYQDNKVYQVIVYIEDNEATGVNELEQEDIDFLIQTLKEGNEDFQDDDAYFYEEHAWAKQFVSDNTQEVATQVNMKFEGDFGTLNITIEPDGYTFGQYQGKGMLEGTFKNDEFSGEWRNKGMEGLIEFSVSDNKLIGSWKKGLDKGAMRGKWEGDLIESN